MSQGEKAKCTKENEKIERYESGGDGSMLEEFWLKELEEEVLNKYKVEDSKREAFKGRGGGCAEARKTK